MLFKLLNKRALFNVLTLFGYYFSVSQCNAKDFNVHGFLSQGVANNSDSNFISNERGITFDLTEVGLNFSYQYAPSIRFAGQASYLNGGNRYDEGVNLDYLLVDWNFYSSDTSQGHFYAGRIKNYHRLYSSTRDVPVSRPSIILPQSVYLDSARDLDIGGDGVAFSYSYSTEPLGQLDFKISSAPTQFTLDEVRNLIGDFVEGDITQEEDLQASFYWSPNSIPFTIGIAIIDSFFEYNSTESDVLIDGELDLMRYYINFEYFSEKWTLSSELVQEEFTVSGLFANEFETSSVGQGGFIQAQYRPNDRLKMLMRYERYYGDKNDRNGEQAFIDSGGTIPAFFGFQHDFTLGVSYELSANVRFDIEHHWITGTARLTPLLIPDVVRNSEKNRQLSLIQISYWF